MVTIPHGSLPTHSALFTAARAAGVSTRSLLEVMSQSLRLDGPNEGLHQLLRSVGFTWAPAPKASDLDLDVAAVAAALCSPAASPSDSRHGAVELEPGPTPRRERQTVPGTTGDAAGDFHHDAPKRARRRSESRAHRIERAFYGDVLGED